MYKLLLQKAEEKLYLLGKLNYSDRTWAKAVALLRQETKTKPEEAKVGCGSKTWHWQWVSATNNNVSCTCNSEAKHSASFMMRRPKNKDFGPLVFGFVFWMPPDVEPRKL